MYSNWVYFSIYDTRVKRSEVRRKLACRRIFDLGTRQKHFLLNLWISQQRQQHLPYNLARHRRRCTGRIQRRG